MECSLCDKSIEINMQSISNVSDDDKIARNAQFNDAWDWFFASTQQEYF